jgi:hypothetical protein
MSGWVAGTAFAAALLLGMLVMLEVGRRTRRHRIERGKSGEPVPGAGAVEAAIFAILGLLVAFTFSSAGSRFDQRRALIIEEANDIGTAYLRLDLLPPEPRAALQEQFRQYVDARLAAYRAVPDLERVRIEVARSVALQGEIWTRAVAATREAPSPAGILLLPALNAMIDIATTRIAMTRMHPPIEIFLTMGVLALACALLAGYAMGASPTRSWLHTLGFAAIVALTVYVTVDLEFPRLGMITVEAFDEVLVDVRASMR